MKRKKTKITIPPITARERLLAIREHVEHIPIGNPMNGKRYPGLMGWLIELMALADESQPRSLIK